MSCLRETSAVFATLQVESLLPKPEDQASVAQVSGGQPPHSRAGGPAWPVQASTELSPLGDGLWGPLKPQLGKELELSDHSWDYRRF